MFALNYGHEQLKTRKGKTRGFSGRWGKEVQIDEVALFLKVRDCKKLPS